MLRMGRTALSESPGCEQCVIGAPARLCGGPRRRFSLLQQAAYTRRASRSAGILLVVVALAAVLAGCGTSREKASFPIGVGVASSEPETAADGGQRFFASLHALRMTTARLVLYRGNPRLREGLRRAVIHASGIDVSVVLLDHPRAIRTGGDVAAFADWAAGVARDLPAVRRFVVWNEPNTRAFWRGSPGRYAELLSATYRALKAVDPELRVSGLGLSPRHRPLVFLRMVLRAGGRMDELSIHPYPPSDASTADAAYAFVHRVEGVWHGPLNLDEFGWQVRASGRAYAGRETVAATTERRQALRYATFLRLASKDPQVRTALVYGLHDDADLAAWQAGLERADGTQRAAYSAVANLLAER